LKKFNSDIYKNTKKPRIVWWIQKI
jgi:hypothetical protein